MTKLSKRLPDDYAVLLAEVKGGVRSAQYEALKAVNKELVALYWDIGKLIVERQDREGWGKSVVERLANDLQNEFSGIGGFSTSNQWRMKGFCEAYVDFQKPAPLVREIGWSQNIVIMERCKDPLEREFYNRMTRKFGWSKELKGQLPSLDEIAKLLGGRGMNDLQSRWDIHMEREDTNAEVVKLVAIIKKNFEVFVI